MKRRWKQTFFTESGGGGKNQYTSQTTISVYNIR